MTRLFVALLAGCSGPAPGTTRAPALDEAAYARDVHPIVEARCATLDCHGERDRPLRLYAETGLRARDELRDQPITDDELAADVAAVSVLSGVDVDHHLVLLKALDLMHHEGGAVWRRGEPQEVCVRGWLAGESDAPATVAACAQARLEVALPTPR